MHDSGVHHPSTSTIGASAGAVSLVVEDVSHTGAGFFLIDKHGWCTHYVPSTFFCHHGAHGLSQYVVLTNAKTGKLKLFPDKSWSCVEDSLLAPSHASSIDTGQPWLWHNSAPENTVSIS